MSEIMKKKQHGGSKKTLAIVIGIVLLIGIACGVYFLIIKKDNTDNTYKIAQKVLEKIGTGRLLEESKDTSYKYGCQYSTTIYFDSVDGISSSDKAIVISRYMNNIEAELRTEFLINGYKQAHEKMDNTVLSETDSYITSFEDEKDILYPNGLYMVRISSKLKNGEEYKKIVDEIISKYQMEEVATGSYEEIKKYWDGELDKFFEEFDAEYKKIVDEFNEGVIEDVKNMEKCVNTECDELLDAYKMFEKYDDFKDGVAKINEAYNKAIAEKKKVVDSINSSITKLKKSLSESELDSLKEKIKSLSDSYYDSYKTGWNSQLASLEESVFKKACKSYNYKDLLRYPEKYKGKKAYFFGEVVQKVSSTQFRVSVNCKKYHYISGYNCSDTIYVTYYGDLNLLEDDMVKLWGTMDETVTYTTVMNTTVTIPSFDAEYATISK